MADSGHHVSHSPANSAYTRSSWITIIPSAPTVCWTLSLMNFLLESFTLASDLYLSTCVGNFSLGDKFQGPPNRVPLLGQGT